MLKLKYLFDNRDLATMLLKNWHYDEESLGLFDYFRISSNAIYPFNRQEKVCFLRFVPAAEKSVSHIHEELAFMSLLRENGFNVPGVIKSCHGNVIETMETPWGAYHAVVFERVGKETLENTDMTEAIAYDYGRSLAKLHQISQQQSGEKIQRESVFDVLDRMESALQPTTDTAVVVNQIHYLRQQFQALETSVETFGLIHYDYELDNILVDEEAQKLYAIDFDDCLYGFYGQDVERAINSIESEISEAQQEAIQKSFLNGYAEGHGDLTLYKTYKELFKAFADLYAFFRMRTSLEETWDNEPDWMVTLRGKLSERMRRYLAQLAG